MSSPLVENFAVQTGTTTPATNGITPSGAPRLALIGGTTDHGIDSFSAPDASWTVIVDGIQWFWKLLTSAAAIATSQVIGNPNHIWVSLLTLFGSDGSVPVFTPSSVGNQTNPGTGNFK